MSHVVVNEVRAGFYLDSVALMRLSARLGEHPSVDEAVLMVGTASNLAIMHDAGLLTDDGRAAGPNDLVIAIRARDEAAARDTLTAAREALVRGSYTVTGEAYRPRSLHGALQALPDANLALISTPGEFAAREANTALARGLNVMIFSDNVPLNAEKALKRDAAARGLLLMGPDCGTAYIAGTPLAFANEVPRGNVGVIAASGTGLQEFAVLLSRLGAGISHGIGVGGRDLSDEVGGLSTLFAIDLLAADAGTQHLVLISKPPGEATAARVFERLAACGKPATACVFGVDAASVTGGIALAPTLKAAAEQVTGQRLAADDSSAVSRRIAAELPASRRWVRGLFCGGTLCTEAQAVLHRAGLAVSSNAPLPGHGGGDSRNRIIDLGADEYTLGRPHPMIEPAARTLLLAEALADGECAVVLLDVVLGHGAHDDPAGAVAAAVDGAGPDRPCVIASLCGTPGDPQGYEAQAQRLRDAGVVLAPSNADAAALAAAIGRARQS